MLAKAKYTEHFCYYPTLGIACANLGLSVARLLGACHRSNLWVLLSGLLVRF